MFVGEVASNLLYRARLKPSGVGLTALRADRDVEFLASTDIWFRPVQFANGPDGCLYVIDMYRKLIQAAAFLPPAILKHLDVSGGFDKGRLYRIVPEGFKRPKPPRLGKATDGRISGAAGASQRLAPRHGLAPALPATRPVGSGAAEEAGRRNRNRRWVGCTPCTPWMG